MKLKFPQTTGISRHVASASVSSECFGVVLYVRGESRIKMAVYHVIYSTLIFMSTCKWSEGGAVFVMNIQEYYNPGAREYDGSCCDFAIGRCGSTCDHNIHFCLDPNDGRYKTSIMTCREWRGSTGWLLDQTRVVFRNPDRKGYVNNPVIIKKPSWPGSIVLKVYVRDRDHWDLINPYSDVDTLIEVISLKRSYSLEKSEWRNYDIKGTRTSTTPTWLKFQVKVYCEENYFGERCDVHCIAQDGNLGHYTCHPENGGKVCRPGWEEPATNCRIRADDCAGEPCSRGKCVDGVRQFTCQCPSGYTGVRCEVDIDECEESPCVRKNTQQCIDQEGTFICQCIDGFVGAKCEFHLCDRDLGCQNGGTCVANGDCLCADGFRGDHCQINICHTKLCQNGGRCIYGHCLCPQAYAGEHCETEICKNINCIHGYCEVNKCVNPCNDQPCQNDGTCYYKSSPTELNPYHCVCLPKFTGINCESTITVESPVVEPSANDTCKDVTCINGGLCYNGTCLCPLPYTGLSCQNRTDYCATGRTICLNGGMCYSGTSSFFCVCPHQFIGDKCQTPLSAVNCVNTVCQHNGTCIDGRCRCTSGWQGDSCEKQVGCLPNPCQNGGSCYRGPDEYICLCTNVWQGDLCDRHANKGTIGPTGAPIPEGGVPGWVIGLIHVVLVILIAIGVAAAVVLTRRRTRKRKGVKSAGAGLSPPRPITKENNRGSFENPAFNNGHGVYENVDESAEHEYSYATQNDIKLNIAPQTDGNVYSTKLPMGTHSSSKPLAQRSQSYDGIKPQKGVSASASGKNARSGRRLSAPEDNGGEYIYAKVDKKSTKSKELKTPKHLQERYQTVRSELKT